METVVPIIAGIVATVAALLKGGGWLRKKLRERKARKGQRALAANPPYPVRLTCREETEFHPGSGYHEGLVFEVFNHSDKPVTVKGFGLDITMQGQAEWHEHELARHHPPYNFPARLAPNDALDGYIDTDVLADEIYERGDHDYVVSWSPYVEVAGFGEKTVEAETT
ncbi:MAG: hypothetical protein M3346_09695 [Actinomycetota bacterium]|nr:hypothetical protein [Actinomycetota bacterium]